MNPIRSIRGMHDLLPEDLADWHQVESIARGVLAGYGFDEIRLPLVEKTELFTRGLGATSDVVSKEMYSFEDASENSLTLRPEGTAGCVRAVIENGLLHQGATQRLWYAGPMFRRERPQRGRQRQFHQIGVEIFGPATPDADAELVLVAQQLWQRLGLKPLQLQINSLGTSATREQYRQVLQAYLRQHQDQLDDDSRRRLDTNPMRVLDSKNPALADVIAGAPVLLDHLPDDEREHFETFRALLDAANVSYTINPHLVRGLDYYSHTVFEWVTDELGAQGTVCAGGRYDALIELQGGPKTAASGFALGMERLVELLPQSSPLPVPHVYAVIATAPETVIAFIENLRQTLPWLRLTANLAGGSFKAQFKRADRSGARYAMVLGESEAQNRTTNLKPLRRDADQETVAWDEVSKRLRELLQPTSPSPGNGA